MDVSPQLLREVEFREQWRGYNPDEVDDFLERVAAALERLQERLKETADRAARAERRLTEESGDEALKRTLVLAQRTAQSALEEATAEAENLVGEAQERAAALVEAAEQRAAELDAETQARAATTVQVLAEERAVLEADVVALQAWVETQQRELADWLRRQLEVVEGPGRLSLPAPPVLSPRPEPPAEGEGAEGEELVDLTEADSAEDEEPHAPSEAPGDDHAVAEVGAEDGRERAEDGAPDDEVGHPGRAAESHDDPFLAELRRAVDDPEPLGPRTDLPRTPDRQDELTPAGRFRRRRRT